MQGGMVMPMIRYEAGASRLRVMLSPAIPRLTPLLASNPADSFNPADPWFDLLDPAAQGYSFSRRYGFVMDTMTDPLPAGLQIWIRKLSGPPELLIYRYASSTPKAFEPIFGTAGAASAMRWSGMMFHPVFAAPPGTNELSASFEAYLVDGTSGAELSGSSTGPFELHWTNWADPRPALSMAKGAAGTVVLSWPATATNFVLQCATALGGGQWAAVTNAPALNGELSSVSLGSDGSRMFFRMERGQ